MTSFAWRLSVCAAALAAVAACEQTPLESPRDPPPEVLTTAVSNGRAGIFRTLSVQLDRPGAVVAEYWASDGARLRVQSAEEAASSSQQSSGQSGGTGAGSASGAGPAGGQP